MIRKMLLTLCVAAATASAQKPDTLEAAKKTWTGIWEGPAWHIGETDPLGHPRVLTEIREGEQRRLRLRGCRAEQHAGHQQRDSLDRSHGSEIGRNAAMPP